MTDSDYFLSPIIGDIFVRFSGYLEVSSWEVFVGVVSEKWLFLCVIPETIQHPLYNHFRREKCRPQEKLMSRILFKQRSSPEKICIQSVQHNQEGDSIPPGPQAVHS